MELYECPDCRTLHEEPAEATLRLHVLCLDCSLEQRYHDELVRAVIVRKAA